MIPPPPARERRALLLILAAAAAWRLVLVSFPETTLNSDNALYGLMAGHMLRGEFPLFTWGQDYMGTLESAVGAFFYAIFGTGYRALQLSPLLFSLLYLWVLWRLARELFGAGPALWAAAYAAAAPFPLYVWSLAPRGGYSETLFFGTAVLLLTILILRRGGGGVREWIALGLAAGVGFWTNFLIGYYLLPAGLALLLGLRGGLFHPRTLAGIGAFLLGSLPVWVYNIPRGFPSFAMGAFGTFDRSAGLRLIARRQLPEMLGLAGEYLNDLPAGRTVWLVAGATIYLLLAVPFLWVSLRALVAFLRRRRPSPDVGLLLLFLGALLLLLSGSRFARTPTSRYLLPIHSAIPLVGACAIAATQGLRRRAATALWAALIVLQTVFLGVHLNAFRTVAAREKAETQELLATLLAEGETRGVADYRQTKRLTYLSRERVILMQPLDEQYPPYQTAVEESPGAFFLLRGAALPRALAERGVSFRKRMFDERFLLTAVAPPAEELTPIRREGWKLAGAGASEGWADGRFALPAATRGAPEEEETTIDLGEVRRPGLARILFDTNGTLGSWEIQASADGATWTQVVDPGVREPVFVSGPRAYSSGMFLRAELRLRPTAARFLRIRRAPAAGRPLGRVREFHLLERRAATAARGLSPEIAAYLRDQEVHFVHADRWESAAIAAALGPARASIPFNRVVDREDRNGVVTGGGRIAFLLPAAEAAGLREILTPEVIASERTIGGYLVCIVDIPDPGPTGLRWTGYALLEEDEPGRALWRRRVGLARTGSRRREPLSADGRRRC